MNSIDRIGREISTSSIQSSKVVDKKAIKDNFKVKITNLEQEEIRVKLDKLYENIESKSAKLQNSLFIEDLIQYKKLVKEFLSISVNNSHIFFKENSLDRRGRHRIFSLVKQVDKELDEITEDFLDIENNRINILKKIDNISGILLDIMT